MTLCEKCIHGDVCADRDNMGMDDELALQECSYEKNKADFVEVKHGKWGKTDRPHGYYNWKCSVCGCDEYRQTDRNGRYREMNYCPNCGAKMDGERKEKQQC